MRILSPLFLAAALTFATGGTLMADDLAPTLTVTGSAVVQMIPDLAVLSVGVTTQGTTAGEAMAANSTAMAAVLARLKDAGIEDRDLQTSNLSLNPNWVSNASGTASEIQGYIASNMLTVRILAMDKTGAVLDAAIADGANTLNGLTFGLQNQRPQEDEARKLAVADAMARAKLIAEAAGAKLGPVLSIVEGGSVGPMPSAMFRMAEAAPMPVAGGAVDVTASVTMVFQLGE